MATLFGAVPAEDLLGVLLGQTINDDQATTAIAVVTSLAKSYTRGAGFTDTGPAEDITSVILTAAARLLSNPTGVLYDETEGPSSVSYRSAFSGWTVAELTVLNRYRVRAQ